MKHRAAALTIAAVLLAAAAGCSRGGSNPGLDELPDDEAIVAGEPSNEEFAEIVRIAGDGHLPDSTHQAFAQGLTHYMGAIGDAAADQSSSDFARPDIVALAAELTRDEQATHDMVDAVITWGTQQSQLLAANPNTGAETAYKPVAMVTAALMDGTDTHDNPTLHPTDIANMVTGELRVPLAEAIAEETGQTLPTGIPEPGDRWNGHGPWHDEIDVIIVESAPEGIDPINQLSNDITDQTLSKYSDPENDHWLH